MRHCWRRFDYHAECMDCDWESCARNALGNAAQHCDRTDHTVIVGVEGVVTYCGDAENERRQQAKGLK